MVFSDSVSSAALPLSPSMSITICLFRTRFITGFIFFSFPRHSSLTHSLFSLLCSLKKQKKLLSDLLIPLLYSSCRMLRRLRARWWFWSAGSVEALLCRSDGTARERRSWTPLIFVFSRKVRHPSQWSWNLLERNDFSFNLQSRHANNQSTVFCSSFLPVMHFNQSLDLQLSQVQYVTSIQPDLSLYDSVNYNTAIIFLRPAIQWFKLVMVY